ncbi:MAG: flotillin family protein [Frankiales bacterium]|nr:flotillin family protein [Frankiales bacterium]
MPFVAVVGVAAVVALLVVVVLFKMTWRVAEPNQALIVTGLGARGESEAGADFKIVVGKGAAVVPGFQVARRLSLDSRSTRLEVDCVTQQGIALTVRGVVIYKVGDDPRSISNAARRWLDQQQVMNATIHDVFSGHLRSIVGGLTVEEMIRQRERLTNEVRASSSDEMAKLGLQVDSLQIQEIDDATGYIVNLGAPHAAAVAAAARIAQAQRDQEATQAEQEASALKAAAVREASIKQAGFQAEVDRARAAAQQAGPLSEAMARQDVVVAETRAAQLSADLAEKRLESDVRKPADAEAYRQRTLAEADRDARVFAAEAAKRETELTAVAQATRVTTEAEARAAATRATGEAEAAATQATGLAAARATEAAGLATAAATEAQGLAEARAIQARADALAHNQEAVIAQQIAQDYAAIVAAGASAFQGIDSFVVLNGAEGVQDALAQLVASGGSALSVAKQFLAGVPARPAAPVPDGAHARAATPTAPSPANAVAAPAAQV